MIRSPRHVRAGVGSPGSWIIKNPSCPQPTQSKRLLVMRDVAGVIPSARIDCIWTNSGGASQISVEGFYGSAETHDNYINWSCEDHASEVLTQTLVLRAASSQAAADGVLDLWMNGVRLLHRTDMKFGPDGFYRFGFPTTTSDPPQQQSEYFWDIVAWSSP